MGSTEPAYPSSPFDLCQWLPNATRDAFIRACRRRTIAKGALLYAQDDIGGSMYRLVSGSVRLSVARSDGRELLYLLFSPGDCFGESSCIDDAPRPQTAEAADDVEILELPRLGFDRLRAEHRAFDDALLHLLARHMRLLGALLADAHLTSLAARVAGRLLSMATGFGTVGLGGAARPIALPQAELAAMVGGSRQSVNRILQDLQADGIVALRGTRVLIPSIERLRVAARDVQTAPVGLPTA